MTHESDPELEQYFRDLGLSEAAAVLAARGRPGSVRGGPPVTTVAAREAGSIGPDLAAAIRRGDAAAVQRLAAGRVAPATRSFSEHRPAAESASQVDIELVETFMELGLSEAGATLAAEGGS